ncbi:hypothetical protein K432DRAFT_387664 [Lepidopterella palustris CBS 459.81]|uniref:Retrotransposon gag domain-containing protein n=1 Tax=Lepidopterella palustris CBS 459.81 TaxID=1314670 RepID=A0A8E2J7V9_9PEZI|nr:hypothetical protein K432DRAFT_387664 [Lepidopterella palustris CBS 459.81]
MAETAPTDNGRIASRATPPPPSLDERLAAAKARHAELTKLKMLEKLEAEIKEMEGYTLAPDDDSILPDIDTPVRRKHSEEEPPTDEEPLTAEEPPTVELQPEKLSLYHGKSVREHREWTRSAENAFSLAPRKFKQDITKIAWTAQFLRATPATTWQNIAARESNDYTWDEYKEILLNLIEDPVNRQRRAAQLYAEARQKPHQSAQEFNLYLISLEGQLDEEYTPEQRRIHLWTKLSDTIREAILQY